MFTETKFFKFFPDLVTWFEAKDNCLKSGGRLATPDNERENSQIFEKLVNNWKTWLGFQNLKVCFRVNFFLILL